MYPLKMYINEILMFSVLLATLFWICCIHIPFWLKTNLCETDISNENGNSGMD